MSQSTALYRLQQIDLQIVDKRKRLKAIVDELGDNQTLTEAQNAVAIAEEKLEPLQKRQRQLELEIQTTKERQQATEDRLYSGAVKNPKELQDLQQELAAHKKRQDELEEQQLEQMLLMEEAEEVLATRQAQLKTVEDELALQHGDLVAEQRQLAEATQRLKQDREKALQQVQEANLKRYIAMRPKTANRPIALLEGTICSICGVGQTTSTVQEVHKRDQLVPCDNCGRILALN